MFGTGYFNGRENLRVFLKVTTPEKKKSFLLIEEVFRKLFNTQNDGHLDQLWVAIYYLSGFAKIHHVPLLFPYKYQKIAQ
jgi:hypothetical protein